jgi:serine/threonine protein kinase
MILARTATDLTISVPRKIGPYMIQRVIACGSTSVVVKARSQSNDEHVALKVMNTKTRHPDGYILNVQQELKIINRISHPNIVQIRAVIHFENLVVIAMEYCSESLVDWVCQKTRPSTSTVMWIFWQIAKAIQYLHLHHISHGNIKLDNILINTKNNPKLADFGFSHTKQFSADHKAGTLIYAAPELFCPGFVDKHASDIWSLGIVLFAMMTGHFPYPTTNKVDLMRLIYQGALSYQEIKDNAVRGLVMRMTDVNPAMRPKIDKVVAEAELLKTRVFFNKA